MGICLVSDLAAALSGRGAIAKADQDFLDLGY